VFAGFNLLFRLPCNHGIDGDQFNAWSRQQFIAIETALQCPFVYLFVVAEQTSLPFGALNFEVGR